MAHLIIEYSANLDPEIRPQAIVDTLHAATLATGAFAVGDVRTRAVCRNVYRVGSQDVDNAFVHLTVRVDPGHSPQALGMAADAIFQALADYLDPIYRCTPLAISAELQQIDPQFCFKKNKR